MAASFRQEVAINPKTRCFVAPKPHDRARVEAEQKTAPKFGTARNGIPLTNWEGTPVDELPKAAGRAQLRGGELPPQKIGFNDQQHSRSNRGVNEAGPVERQSMEQRDGLLPDYTDPRASRHSANSRKSQKVRQEGPPLPYVEDAGPSQDSQSRQSRGSSQQSRQTAREPEPTTPPTLPHSRRSERPPNVEVRSSQRQSGLRSERASRLSVPGQAERSLDGHASRTSSVMDMHQFPQVSPVPDLESGISGSRKSNASRTQRSC